MAEEIVPKFTLTKKRNAPVAAPITPTVVNPETGGISFMDLSIPDNVPTAPKVRYEVPAPRQFVPPVVEPTRPFPNTPHKTIPDYIDGKKNSLDFGPRENSQDLTRLLQQNLEEERTKARSTGSGWGIDASTGLLVVAAIGAVVLAATKSKSQNKTDYSTEYFTGFK